MGVVGVVKFAYAQARKSAIFELEHRQTFMQAFALAHIPTCNKRTPTRLAGALTAEDRGFEPLRDCSQHAFQACDIGR